MYDETCGWFKMLQYRMPAVRAVPRPVQRGLHAMVKRQYAKTRLLTIKHLVPSRMVGCLGDLSPQRLLDDLYTDPDVHVGARGLGSLLRQKRGARQYKKKRNKHIEQLVHETYKRGKKTNESMQCPIKR